MTISHWYKGIDMESQKTALKPKFITRCEQVNNKLRSILREHNSNELLLRQQAGLDKSKRGRSKQRKHGGPKVCKFQQQYQRNRQRNLKKITKAQRELREFHSHPVPNFSQLHKRWECRNKMRQMISLQKVTEPQTPLTLINSMKASEKHNMRMQRLNQALNLRHKIKSPSFDSWRKPPFVLRIESSIIKTKPFQLKSVERGERRKLFDEWTRREQEARWRHQAMEWARRRQQEYKELRKLTNFKARPNPCKRIKAQ